MITITCDNCGKEDREEYTGDLCESCYKAYKKERDTLEATIDLMEFELKKKFHIN